MVQFELTKEFVERFQQALDERDRKFILQTLENINPADISALLYEFNSEESKYVLSLLPTKIQAEIINDLDPDTRRRQIDALATIFADPLHRLAAASAGALGLGHIE